MVMNQKVLTSFLLVFSLTLSLFAKANQYNQDIILTLPTGDFKLHQFVKNVEELNPFLNIVTKGLPKADRISFSKDSRFKHVFRNLTQFKAILNDAETVAGGKTKFEFLEDRLTITWSRIGKAELTQVKKGNSFSPPAGQIDQAYRINGTLLIDEYLKYDFKEPVVVDGEMIVDGPNSCKFSDLTINGKLIIKKGSKIEADQILIRGEVMVSEDATVETVDVVFDGEGDLILGENSTLLLTDSAITTK